MYSIMDVIKWLKLSCFKQISYTCEFSSPTQRSVLNSLTERLCWLRGTWFLCIKDTQSKAKHETTLHYGLQECDDLNDHHNNLAVCSYKSIRQKFGLLFMTVSLPTLFGNIPNERRNSTKNNFFPIGTYFACLVCLCCHKTK